MRKKSLIANTSLAALLLIFSACTTAPRVPDRFTPVEYRMLYQARLLLESTAPVTVLGRVVAVRPVGRPIRSHGDPRVSVQLTTISLSVELVLEGAVNGQQLQFYFYTFVPGESGLGMPWYRPTVGDRRIYFLEKLGDDYRSVGDVAVYSLAVNTGDHDADFCRGKSAGCCIAEILLVPQKDYQPDAFARRLIQDEFAASVLCSRSAALKLVSALLDDPDQRVRREAADILADGKANGELPSEPIKERDRSRGGTAPRAAGGPPLR